MGYLKIARELLYSSFWRSLAPAEQAILINLMAMAAYKPRIFNMHGYSIQLDKNELCISINSFAESLNMGRRKLVSLLERFAKNNLLSIRIITASQSGNEVCNEQRNKLCNEVKGYMGRKKFTVISFNASAFGYDHEDVDYSEVNSKNETRVEMSSETSNAMHNKEILKKEVLKKETRRNSACAVPVSNGSKGKEYRKPWYTMEQIAKMDLPYADEIMKEWTEYSGRSKKDVSDILQKFTHKQRLFGLSEMTLDVFNKEFRKEMKSAFALKSKQKNEPQRYLYYYGEDD